MLLYSRRQNYGRNFASDGTGYESKERLVKIVFLGIDASCSALFFEKYYKHSCSFIGLADAEIAAGFINYDMVWIYSVCAPSWQVYSDTAAGECENSKTARLRARLKLKVYMYVYIYRLLSGHGNSLNSSLECLQLWQVVRY